MKIIVIIIDPANPAPVPLIVTPPLVPFGTSFLRLVISLGVLDVLIPISVIHVSELWVAIVVNAAYIKGETDKKEEPSLLTMNGKKSNIKYAIPKSNAGKLFDNTWMESLVESLANSVVMICFWGVLCLDSKEEDRKNANSATQRNGEITYIIIAIIAPVRIPPGIVSNFSFIIMYNKGRLKKIPQIKAINR